MIYVLDMPETGEPRAWFAFNDDDLARKLPSMLIAGGERYIYAEEAEAVGAFEGGDPRIAGKAFWRARRALYEQLVAMDVLADDN
jgi:hypothetical protein